MKITHGPSAELGIGPPQAAWRGAVEHPSGGPSAPGRRCWRLGRKRPSPFFKLGAHSATLRPEFGGPRKSLRCCCAKGEDAPRTKYIYHFLRTIFLLGGPSRCQDASSASVRFI